jgi:CRP-like cAMP-binding protein
MSHVRARENAVGGRPRNRLLAALPEAEFARLLPHLHTTFPRTRQLLHRAGAPLGHVYFPNGGVFSLTVVLPDGAMVETATIGDEGMFCIEAFFLDDPVASGPTLLQVPDAGRTSAVRLPVPAFRAELNERGALYRLIGEYAQTAVAQMTQSAACTAVHQVRERCARWLLMTQDRMRRDEFHLSHEFLAMMLGVQRPTVSVVAGALQDAGLIHCKHGIIRILNRRGLEEASCGCYSVMHAHLDRFARLTETFAGP